MTRTRTRPHLEIRRANNLILEDDELPDELAELPGESTLAEEPFPTDAHARDIARLGGALDVEGHGPVSHERLAAGPEDLYLRAVEDQLETGPSRASEEREESADIADDERLDVRSRPARRRR